MGRNRHAPSEEGAPPVTGPVDGLLNSRGPATGRVDDTLSGVLTDRSHTTAPHAVAAMVSEEFTAAGARNVALWLQDYDQVELHPMPVPGQPLPAVEAVDNSLPGRAFTLHAIVELDDPDGGRRLWVPLLDGTDRVGVIAVTLDDVDNDTRAYVRRLAGNIAHLLYSKGNYTDEFFRLRRRRPLRLAAEMQWDLLPPLAIVTPTVAVAGLLEPAYAIAGDSFDYAMNTEGLHFAIFDAMGHGLASAIMASTAVSAYRHARRSGSSLTDMYTLMDGVVSEQFGGEKFVTAQLATLNLDTGVLEWVNAGHPAPLLVRGNKAVRFLANEPALPVGFGEGTPPVSSEQLEPGDRLLFFSDGVVEHRSDGGEMFGEDRLAEHLLRHLSEHLPTPEVLRRLNRDLLEIVGEGGPSDDATLVLVHWVGPAA